MWMRCGWISGRIKNNQTRSSESWGYDKACNNTGAVRFVQQYLKECELIAKQLDVPVENITGLAAKSPLRAG